MFLIFVVLGVFGTAVVLYTRPPGGRGVLVALRGAG